MDILIANRQRAFPLDESRLRAAVAAVLAEGAIESGEISIAIVDDEEIALLHGRHLGDASPTDVLSFPLEQSGKHLEGEVVVSAETALREARRLNANPLHELLLYVVHGVLHLLGYDDLDPQRRQEMRRAETSILRQLEVEVPPVDGEGAAEPPAHKPPSSVGGAS